MTDFDLQPYGEVFYSTVSDGPLVLRHNGHELVRYMDRIYIPGPPSRLAPAAISDLAELRALLKDQIVDNQYTQAVLGRLYDLATAGQGGLTLLDVGCGDGNIAALVFGLAKRHRPLEVMGVDVCSKVVATARRRLEASGLGTALAIDTDRRIALQSDYFQSATASFVFHFPVSRREAAEIHRILAPGGRLVYNDYRCESDPLHAAAVTATFQSVGFSVDTHVEQFQQRVGFDFRSRRQAIVVCTKRCMP